MVSQQFGLLCFQFHEGCVVQGMFCPWARYLVTILGTKCFWGPVAMLLQQGLEIAMLQSDFRWLCWQSGWSLFWSLFDGRCWFYVFGAVQRWGYVLRTLTKHWSVPWFSRLRCRLIPVTLTTIVVSAIFLAVRYRYFWIIELPASGQAAPCKIEWDSMVDPGSYFWVHLANRFVRVALGRIIGGTRLLLFNTIRLTVLFALVLLWNYWHDVREVGTGAQT
jgi:hypothetical protein